MGSKDRMAHNLRRPLPGPGMIRPDVFFPDPPRGPFFDAMPHPDIMDQNLSKQHMEMQKLAFENERLAATHSVLRQELVRAQQERQSLDAHINAQKAEKGQQMRILLDKMARMDADLQSFEPLRVELQKSRVEVESLAISRQELISKVQQLTKDIERSHADCQQIPLLLSELDGLRQEYQHCRSAYDHEKKIYHDHIGSIQAMEKNYVSMSREREKLCAELARHVGNATYKTNDSQPMQAGYHDNYGTSQGRGPPQSSSSPYGGGLSSGPTSAHMGYEAPRAPAQNLSKSMNNDGPMNPRVDASRDSGHISRGANYGPNQAGSLDANGYDGSRGASGYDVSRGAAYDAQRSGYESKRGPSGYDNQQVAGYDGSRVPAGYDYEAMRAGYTDPRGAAGAQAMGYDASKAVGHASSGAVLRPTGGAGYQGPAGAEYDAPPRGGPGGGRQPTYAGSYGTTQANITGGGAPYRGGNAQS